MNWNLFFDIIYYTLTYGIFLYSVVLVGSYLFIAIYSIGETRKYLHKNSFTDYRLLAASPHSPSVSILAPAYNESRTIVANVRSLLSIYYHKLELIIINDGSKDDSLQRLIDAYDLEPVPFYISHYVETKPVKAVYRSRNPIYARLTVVDKVNGGKADALNVGINIASHQFLVCIDVDCVLEQDALLKMVKPFLEETNTRVIASGGVIRIANSCVIRDGHLVKVRLPRRYLPRTQALEYIRAFILGRMAWSRLNGLMLISGAFGAFDREIVIRCGGYNTATVGEDMELVVRMRRYMEEQGRKYRVTYIPDPLCWTEVPDTTTILGKQRNRWTRGLYETLRIHRTMFFNPRYHFLGMLSYPYWFFFELCSPLIEFFGFFFFLLFTVSGLIDWEFFVSFLVFIISFGYLYSAFAVLMEVNTYNQYKRRSDVFILLLTGLAEPFYFHPFVVWSAIKGYIDLLRKKKAWGEMTRRGFSQPTVAPAPVPVATSASPTSIAPPTEEYLPDPEEAPSRFWIWMQSLSNVFADYLRYAAILCLLLLAARIFELTSDRIRHGAPAFVWKVIGLSFLKDLAFFLQFIGYAFPVYALLWWLHKRAAHIFFVCLAILAVSIQFGLSQYFLTTLVPLGSDLWGYSWTEIRQTVQAAGGISWTLIALFAGLLLLLILAFVYLPRKIKPTISFSLLALLLFLLAMRTDIAAVANSWKPGAEYSNNLSTNKSWYFYAASWQHFFPAPQEPDIYSAAYSGDMDQDSGNTTLTTIRYTDEAHYPFLHQLDTSANVLSPFFTPSSTPPNIVILLVEGLGRAFTNQGAYLGNFTPFIDSLAGKSLYWDNFLSAGGRTFAVLPSLMGSLPFARNGFDDLGENMPAHFSLLSLLAFNGYETSFSYGGDAHFDNMDIFLHHNHISHIYDESSFPAGYAKMPANNGGFSWGYGDKELFRHYFSVQPDADRPYASVLLTVSTHSPFFINEQDRYLQRFEQRMSELNFSEGTKQEHRDYKYQYASILFMDDAVRAFIQAYAQRKDFSNTIFLITGDHRMPEIPMSDKLDRYHVPLIVFSPLLKRTARFSSLSSHLDIAPSLLTWLRQDHHLNIPLTGSWIGTGLDTAHAYRNIHAWPLMQTKNDLIDYIAGNYMLNGNDLYHINAELQLTPVTEAQEAASLRNGFDRFKSRNDKMLRGIPLIPDSLYRAWSPK